MEKEAQKEKTYIHTFIMFDTETTGLPSPGNNPKITELCFLALTRDELITKQKAPRVLNKLLVCFNPNRKIDHGASAISGLYNDALETLATFKQQAALLCTFLNNLPKPACLIAHNGNRFDFPLLISEWCSVGEEVPDVLCADSLEAFRMFDGLPAVPEFVQERQKGKVARSPDKTTENSEKSCEGREGLDIHVTTGGACEQGEMLTEVTSQIDSPNLLKRAHRDTDTVKEKADKYKEPKLSEIWQSSEVTPQKSSVDTTDAEGPHKKHTFADVPDHRKNLRRQLFDSSGDTVSSSVSSDHYDHTAQIPETDSSSNTKQTGSRENQIDGNSSEDQSSDKKLSQNIGNRFVSSCAMLTSCKEQPHPHNQSVTNANSSCLSNSVSPQSTNQINENCCAEKESVDNFDSWAMQSLTDSDVELITAVSQAEQKLLQDSTSQDNILRNESVTSQTATKPHGASQAQDLSTSSTGQENCHARKAPVDYSEGQSLKCPEQLPQSCKEINDESSESSTVECRDVSGRKKEKIYTKVVNAHVGNSKVSYGLASVYAQTFGQFPEVSHTAEDDCQTLLKLIHNMSEIFPDWCDQHAVSLKSVSPMY